MTPQRFDALLSIVGPAITRKTTQMRAPVSPGERLAVTSRYLTTGDSMQTISFSYHLGHSTVCNIVKDTCREMWNALPGTYLHTPTTVDEWKRISDGFIINGISQTVLGQLMGNTLFYRLRQILAFSSTTTRVHIALYCSLPVKGVARKKE